jgi:hypothetical protein
VLGNHFIKPNKVGFENIISIIEGNGFFKKDVYKKETIQKNGLLQ